jgi:SAM-dependent methyltransferase
MTLCPLCQGTNAVHFLRTRDHASGDWFDLNQCRNCGLIFLADVPADIGRYYHAYYRRYQPWIQQIFRIAYRAHARMWARGMGRKGRALEIGCGEGWMLAALRDEGWETVGLERSAETAEFATRVQGLKVVVGELDALKSEGGFDLIFMHHVLEHLPDMMAALRLCASLLKPDGVLLVIVPNVASWQFQVSGRHWFHLDVPRHIVQLAPATLTEAMKRVGLQTCAVHFVSIQDLFGWMVSLLNLCGFPQTRWLHWLAARDGQLSLTNVAMLALSPLMLLIGFLVAPVSWMAGKGACVEVRAGK